MKRRRFLTGVSAGLAGAMTGSAYQGSASAESPDSTPKVVIAAFQGRCVDDFDQNLSRVLETIDSCGDQGVDFLCFPETYLSNYGRELSVPLDDPRINRLVEASGQFDMVTVVGLSETEGEAVFNTALVLYGGRILGKYRKTMLTGSDKKVFASDFSLPTFEAKGIPFGVIICHDSSFVEPAFTIRCKGARLLFSPHYNSILADRMDEHRRKVRNNHIGLSALLQMVVVRSNVVGRKDDQLGYGDSTIFSPLGDVVAEAPLFKETVIFAEFERSVFQRESWASRNEIPAEVTHQLCLAAGRG